MPVVEPIAVADIEALLAAIPPDRELYEPRKYLQKGAVELSCVDTAGDQSNDVGAAAVSVTSRAIRMGGFEPAPGQKVMHQRVNGNQLHANFKPKPDERSAAPITLRKDSIRALAGSGLVSSTVEPIPDRSRPPTRTKILVETVEAMQKPLLRYRDDLRVEVESGYEANAS